MISIHLQKVSACSRLMGETVTSRANLKHCASSQFDSSDGDWVVYMIMCNQECPHVTGWMHQKFQNGRHMAAFLVLSGWLVT
jgi:hypothetical protein